MVCVCWVVKSVHIVQHVCAVEVPCFAACIRRSQFASTNIPETWSDVFANDCANLHDGVIFLHQAKHNNLLVARAVRYNCGVPPQHRCGHSS